MADFIVNFLSVLKSYTLEMLPPLFAGFFISGLIHEFIPTDWVQKYLGKKGIKPIIYSTIMGTLAPVCFWGSLPIAVSFHKKGASLGPIFAFLAATPATSVSALFVAWRFLGLQMTIYIFFAVILMGIIVGLIGDLLKTEPKEVEMVHKHEEGEHCPVCHEKRSVGEKVKSVCKFAFITMPKDIGGEILIGLVIAALVSTVNPVGVWIKSYLAHAYGYLFALVAGLIVYVCSTMSVPLVHALIKQGMNAGAALGFLILGPIASFGTILVLRKKFGFKVLLVFLAAVSALSLLAGYIYTLL